MRSFAPSSILETSEAQNTLGKSVEKERRKSKANESYSYTAFQRFRSFSQQIYPLRITKIDSMWSHIGQLDYPLETLIQNRYPIIDIVFANEVIAIRSFNGLCSIYSNWSFEFMFYINTVGCEIIRSVYFNPRRDELIIVSCSGEDDYIGLSCFAIKTTDLSMRMTDRKVRLFSDTSIKFPGFVEFDSPNGLAVYYAGRDKSYRIFSLDDYSELYQLSSHDIQDIKLTPGSLILFRCEAANRINIRFHDTQQGKFKGEFTIMISSAVAVEFVERCGFTILLKQVGKPLKVYDIETGETRTMHGTEANTANDFAFLYSAKMFILHKRGTFEIYTFECQKIFTFASKTGEKLLHAPMCVNQSQEYFVCTSNANTLKVYMFSLKDGREIFCSEVDRGMMSGFSMTSIACDDESHCIVCGDEVGTSNFWL
jgi:hypothetical protein